MGELVERAVAIEGEEVFAGDDWMQRGPIVGHVLFPTRVGPACLCGSTTYVYRRDGRFDVIAHCAECHAQVGFRLGSTEMTSESCVEAHVRIDAEGSAEGWV